MKSLKLFTIIIIILFLSSCDSDPVSSKSFTLKKGSYLLNELGDLGTLSYVDDNLNITNGIQVLGKAPNDLMIADNELVVVNSLNNSIQIIGNGTIELGNGVNPMFITQNEDFYFVTSLYGSTLYKVNKQDKDIKTIEIPGGSTGSDAILYHKDYLYINRNDYDYTAERFDPEFIFKINPESGAIIDSVVTGINVHDMLVDNHNQLHVLSKGNYTNVKGSISVIDLTSFTVVKTIELGSSPGAFVLDQKDYVYVAVSGMDVAWNGFGKILKYRASDGEIINGDENPVYNSPNSGIMGISIDNQNRLFATVFDENKVLIFKNDQLVKILSTGNGPGQIIYSTLGKEPEEVPDIPYCHYLPIMASCETITYSNLTGKEIETSVTTDLSLEKPGDDSWIETKSITLTNYSGQTIKIFARTSGDVKYSEITLKIKESYPDNADSDFTTAIPLSDQRIKNWANKVVSYQYFSEIDSAFTDKNNALGKAGGNSYEITCLGDSGSITVSFPKAITNGEDVDFAIFENSFDNSFLEFAYVEVSTDGANFVRFPSAYLGTDPIPGYGGQDTKNVGGLAGKYKQGFGDPYDLEVLKYHPDVQNKLIDIDNIKYIRIQDIKGDGSCTDSFGRKIYDPYPGGGSPGFDLDGIAVINEK